MAGEHARFAFGDPRDRVKAHGAVTHDHCSGRVGGPTRAARNEAVVGEPARQSSSPIRSTGRPRRRRAGRLVDEEPYAGAFVLPAQAPESHSPWYSQLPRVANFPSLAHEVGVAMDEGFVASAVHGVARDAYQVRLESAGGGYQFVLIDPVVGAMHVGQQRNPQALATLRGTWQRRPRRVETVGRRPSTATGERPHRP